MRVEGIEPSSRPWEGHIIAIIRYPPTAILAQFNGGGIMRLMTWFKSFFKPQSVARFINWSLILATVLSASVLVYDGFTRGWNSEIFNWRESYTAALVFSVITFALNRAINLFAKKNQIILPQVLMLSIIIFSYSGLFLGSGLNFYSKFWWWDDLLHTVSGVIAGLVGFLLVYYLNARHNMNISPLFVAVFAFTFAIAIGVAWEVFEFSWDWAFKTNMQRWAYQDSMLIGHDWQGTGLRDTMSDLIVDTVGALVASVFCYRLYKKDRTRALDMMQQTFPNIDNEC